MDILRQITEEFNLRADNVKNVVALLDDGNTIPFIARYRKEMTGHIDDQVLRELSRRNVEKDLPLLDKKPADRHRISSSKRSTAIFTTTFKTGDGFSSMATQGQ